MTDTKPENFRLSRQARTLLADIAKANGITKTDVVEHCVARYALELGLEVERARALLLTHLAQGVAARQPKKSPPRR